MPFILRQSSGRTEEETEIIGEFPFVLSSKHVLLFSASCYTRQSTMEGWFDEAL